MPLPKLTYEDFKARISIQEVLQDAGYRLNRKDGLRYPSYVRVGTDGRRVGGDKFIVSGHGTCCFQPPERKNYNIISFIKSHPYFFADYRPGMSLDRLVNVVCHRLLNQPLEEREKKIVQPQREHRPFDLSRYDIQDYNPVEERIMARFRRFLSPRGISDDTALSFLGKVQLVSKKREDGKRYTNIAFPLTVPGDDRTVGFELRGYPDALGKSSYKGLAEGSDATRGLWIANVAHKPLEQVAEVYWFESAYDAMSFFQMKENDGYMHCSALVSTSGSPSRNQFKSMIDATPNAVHHLCFDRDRAGKVFAVNFALIKSDREFSTSVTQDGNLMVIDKTGGKYERHDFSLEDFDFEHIAKELGIDEAVPYPKAMDGYLESLYDSNDMFSGNPCFLTGKVADAYMRYESLEEELHDAMYSGMVCGEELEEMKVQLSQARETYETEMRRIFPIWPPPARKIEYEPCDAGYKDWNDQLRDIPVRNGMEETETAGQNRGMRR